VPLVNVVNETIHNEVSTYIRYLAYNSNECYVVVGVITDNNSIVETDSYGNSVTVPSVIYRIALAINGDTYRVLCCSYNNNDDINLQFHTISELEEMTGICYFPNLKTIVGDEKYFEIKNLISEKI
jgi:DNA/RNA endonuclease G (NUC1)